MTRFVLHHSFNPADEHLFETIPSGKQRLNSLRHGILDVLFLVVHLTEIFSKIVDKGITSQLFPLPKGFKSHQEFLERNEREVLYLYAHESFYQSGLALYVLQYQDPSPEFFAIRRHVLRLSERILRSNLFPLPTKADLIVFKVRILYSRFVSQFSKKTFTIDNIQFCVDCLRDVVVTANICKGKTHRVDDIIYRIIKSLTSMLSLEYLINDDVMQFFADSNFADATIAAMDDSLTDSSAATATASADKVSGNGSSNYAYQDISMDYLVSRVSGYLFSARRSVWPLSARGSKSRPNSGDQRTELSPRPTYSSDDFGIGDPSLLDFEDSSDSDNALTGRARKFGLSDEEDSDKRAQARERELLYSRQRASFKVYANDGLHRTIIMSILSLLVNNKGLLYFDHNLCAQTFLVLRAHFDHPANYALVPRLLEQTKLWAPQACPILRFLCRGMFDQNLYDTPQVVRELPTPSYYSSKVKLAPDYNPEYDGFEVDETKVCIELQDLRDTAKISNRIATLLRCTIANNSLKNEPRALYLYDYGTSGNAGWMVTQAHCGNLLDWRLAQKLPFETLLPLYLQIYRDVLEACAILPKHGINHLNISCFAFMCRPFNFHETRDTLNGEDYTGKSSPLFTPVLSHFHHCVFRDSSSTDRASAASLQPTSAPQMTPSSPRLPGESTLFMEVQGPDVFLAKDRVEYNERRDVWAIGCLLFELITAHTLFRKDDMSALITRLTNEDMPVLEPKDEEELHHVKPLIDFLKSVLIRDINKRPTIEETIELFDKASMEVLGLSSPLKPTPIPYSGSSPSGTDYSAAHGSASSAASSASGAKGPTDLSRSSSVGRGSLVFGQLPHTSARMLSDVSASLVYIALPSVLAESLLRVRKSLYVGGPKCLRNCHDLINHYHITHVIDFTNNEEVLASLFTVMSINTQVTPLSSLPQLLDQIVSFVRAAFLRNGRVLILSPMTRSIGVAAAVALLIAFENMTTFEACLFIRHRSYSLSIQQPIISALRQMSLRYRVYRGFNLCVPCAWKIPPFTHFRCFCGNFSASLRAPAHVYECNCSHDKEDPLCPTMYSGASCSDFREYCSRKFWWNIPSVKWVYVDRSQLRFDASRMDWMTTDLRTAFSLPTLSSTTAAAASSASSSGRTDERESQKKNAADRHYVDVNYRDEKKSGWRIFVCRLCKCICCAVRKIPAATLNEVPLHIRKQYAVCANIDCSEFGFGSRVPLSPDFIEPFLINDDESSAITDT